MGKTIVVTGSFTVAWDADTYRQQYESDLTDEQIADECLRSVEEEWSFYAGSPDTREVQVDVA